MKDFIMKLKTALFVLVSVVSVTALTACGKKEAAQETDPAPASTEASAAEETPVTNIEVSPDMIDAAPLEGQSASEAKAQ
jgi:predicted small lipoprotein YifL